MFDSEVFPIPFQLPRCIKEIYDASRLRSALGYQSPIQFEFQLGQQVAWL